MDMDNGQWLPEESGEGEVDKGGNLIISSI